jgi:SAM-dependent methyltransferase
MSSAAESKLHAVLPLLRCVQCGAGLQAKSAQAFVCAGCGGEVPIRDGIPRFVETPDDELAQRTQASFGYEWTHFDDWKASGATNFQDYFSGLDLRTFGHAQVLDAGCGMGRHARQLAPHCAWLIAIDFSRAIDAAARNVNDLANVTCVQADLTKLPVADDQFDFVYSMGVVHHLADTEAAVAGLVRKLRPGGHMRLYLYWKRSGWTGWVLGLVNVLRAVTTRLPFAVLRALCYILSIVLYIGVVLPYRALMAIGVDVGDRWPLFVYTKYSFTVLYNDQFDRFSAPLEKRYSEDEARALLENAGLRNVSVHPMFGWIVDGVR